MIAEKLPIRFNIKDIRDYFNTHVKHLEPVCQTEMFGGWSILSSSGNYWDGFQQGHAYFVYNSYTKQYEFDYEKANREIGFTWPKEHINLTQVGTGCISEIIGTLRKIGLKPCRARWTKIEPHGATVWHKDEHPDLYGVRLHIPVITNPKCAFETKEGKFHMPADGSCYLVNVNCLHRAYNDGNEARIHIIMDVSDDVGISQYHRTHKAINTKKFFNKWDLIRVMNKILCHS